MTGDPCSFCWDQGFAAANLVVLVVAALIARSELHSWWDERLITRKIEVAENLLGALYDFLETFEYIRNPFIFEGEGSTRKRGDLEDPELSRMLDHDYVAIERMHESKNCLDRYFSLRGQTLAVLGREFDGLFVEAGAIKRDLQLAYRYLARRAKSRLQGHVLAADAKQKNILFKNYEEPDEIDSRLSQLRDEVETKLSPVLKRKPPREGRWWKFWSKG